MKSGKLIDNTWQIIDECDRGGQAQIYKVSHINNFPQEVYALKFLHKQNDEERRQRMYFEVVNLNQLQNTHILNIIASNAHSYKTSEKLYYVCPYINGCTLEQYVLNNDISYVQAISFFLDFINTICFCHDKTIYHRDIKPDNIMLENNTLTDYVLIDFGLSFNAELPQENITPTDQQLGNRFLLLPELVGGLSHDKQLPQSDISQCCGILFYLLTKQIPHTLVDGNNNPPHRREQGFNALKSSIPNHIIFSNILALFDKGFAVNINNRYQTINELISDVVSINDNKVNKFGGALLNNSKFEITNNNSNTNVLKYSQLIRELNPNPEICNPSGLQLPLVTNVNELMNYGIAINSRTQQNIVKAYNEHNFTISAELIWPRSINILRNRILSLGEDFVADMVETDDLDYVRNLHPYKVICLANDLGFIDKSGSHKLLRANEYYNFYTDDKDGSNEEMPQDEANIIIKACIQYILYNNDDSYGLQFNDFREKLKTKRISEIFDDDASMFATCPYFYLKTTVRSLIKLFKETDGIEFENVTTNLSHIIPQIWQRLKTEEKLVLADAYTDYVNISDIPRTDALNKILLKVQGFDYVKENVRSRTFISVANKLRDVHFGSNNFYNEPSVIRTLENLGTKFPKLALKSCITSILFIKLGNSYNTSWDAEIVADRLLDRLTEDEWATYLDRYLKEETLLLESISGPNKIMKMYNQWKLVVKKYDLKNININNTMIKKLF